MPKTNDTPLEEDEQATFVQWLEAKKIKFTAIPNSTWTHSWSQKVKNKKTGLRPGFPDMVCALPAKGLLFIEMKRRKGGFVSPEQQQWLDALQALDGVEARACYGCDNAIAFVEEIMNA